MKTLCSSSSKREPCFSHLPALALPSKAKCQPFRRRYDCRVLLDALVLLLFVRALFLREKKLNYCGSRVEN